MPTPIVHYRRQQVVTQVITASSTPSSAAKSKGFPVAVAVPALIGGMAVAVAGFLLFWWISKRRRREKRVSLIWSNTDNSFDGNGIKDVRLARETEEVRDPQSPPRAKAHRAQKSL